MDEPTAHLDAPAAQALIKEVAEGTKGTKGTKGTSRRRNGVTHPAVILVSHRAEDIAACDRTVKLG